MIKYEKQTILANTEARRTCELFHLWSNSHHPLFLFALPVSLAELYV